MRVALVKGRIDRESEATFAADVTSRPPFYFFSWIIADLEPACRKQGWDVDVLSIGKPTTQRIHLPNVVVNLITEPLVCRRALDRLGSVFHERRVPILNTVEAVRRSSRTALPGVIGASGAKGVRVPMTTRFAGASSALEKHIEDSGHRWPVLLRPAGKHGSQGLVKVDSASALRSLDLPRADRLVSDYAEFRSGDGLYRKYRMIWVDGSIFRRHLIAGREWNVTGPARTEMRNRPETIEAEKVFLASQGDALEARIAELFRIVGLDFGVIDFNLSDADEITVFELNGTFQISGSLLPEQRERWGHLEDTNQPIVSALVDLIARRAASSRASAL